MKRKQTAIAILAAGVLGAAGWFIYQGQGNQPAAAAVPQAADETSALVRTQAVRKQSLPEILTVFGDVAAGKVVTVSFPRAGLVSRMQVVAGQRVHRGAPLATLVSDPAAQTAYAQAVSAERFARAELKRNQELFALQLATQSQVDAARKSLQDATSALNAQRKLGGNLGSATVYAPSDGVVTALAVAQGDRIQPGAPLLQLGRLDTLRIQLGIEPEESRLVRAGMPVTLTTVQNREQSVTAVVDAIQDVVDSKTQLVNATVVLSASSARFLIPGMHVQGAIQIAQHQAWAVPRQAVLTDNDGGYLFQVAQGKARRVNVRKVAESGSLVGVDGTLDPALPVVALGNYELQDGMKVREAKR